MDERDGYEPETESFVDPVTERVRIIGAEPAGPPAAEKSPSNPAPTGAAAYPDDASDPGSALEERYGGFAAGDGKDDEVDPWASTDTRDLGRQQSVPSWLDDGPDDPDEPPISTELPHWTDPPTGQVPAVLERRSDLEVEQGTWSASGDAGPAWREHRHEWDDSAFDPSLLADETTRVGALEEVPLEERQPWEFDDLGTPAAGTAFSGAAAPAAGGGGPSDDDVPNQLRGASSVGRPPVIPESEQDSGPETAGGWARPGANGVPSISSSPLRPSTEPLSPAAIPGARPRKHRRPTGESEKTGSGTGRNVPVSIATGLGFALIAVACFELGSVATLVLSTVVVVLAAAEAYAAFRRSGSHPATLLGLVGTGAVMVSAYQKGVSALPLVFVLVVVTSMVLYLIGAERGSPVAGISSTVLGFAWVGLLGSFAGLLLAPSQYPQRHGVAFLFGAAVATVAADVGALVVGGWRGRHPMAPRVSPHKTWEGLVGGTVFAIVASAAITGQVHPWTPGKAAILGVVAAALAPIGDLCESLIKRDLGLKDMGSLLPGHGGILDRVDGLLFVLPATYYLVRVLHLG
ncbi:MAG TPA: phosphatidate cytidylyltransferase [Acidimicrobiales bacterium]|nr:phosphatidate cytidylyltransferase [Acidimicrobiales bacterium]